MKKQQKQSGHGYWYGIIGCLIFLQLLTIYMFMKKYRQLKQYYAYLLKIISNDRSGIRDLLQQLEEMNKEARNRK